MGQHQDVSAPLEPAALAPRPRFDRHTWLTAAALYLLLSTVFLAFAWGRLDDHTPHNHFAHLADAWLHGRQDIVRGGPSYAHGNDFAEFGGKTYISFPPLPAALMLPFVALAGSPEAFRDGQFVVWLAGLGPAFLFLALERLRLDRRSDRSRRDNAMLAGLFAVGTVYFFTAVQGTVWFAGQVVGVGLLAAFLWVAQDARRPLLAGFLAGCIFLTRPTMLLGTLFFAFELLRVSARDRDVLERDARELGPWTAVRRHVRGFDFARIARTLLIYALPLAACLALAAWTNHSRFGTWNPSAFGHEHLSVAWQRRIAKWGLFGYHYFAKNLGIMLTSLPWLRAHTAGAGEALFRINEHGLALWFTTPVYFLLFAPKRKNWLTAALLISAMLPLVMNLLYQNSGWRQFGYRFSNDYAPLLFLLLAVSNVRLGKKFTVLALWAVAWNAFGAISYDRARYDRYYFRDGSQTIVYQPD